MNQNLDKCKKCGGPIYYITFMDNSYGVNGVCAHCGAGFRRSEKITKETPMKLPEIGCSSRCVYTGFGKDVCNCLKRAPTAKESEFLSKLLEEHNDK